MAKYNAHIERFNIGEYDSAGLSRIDLNETRLSAEIQENVLPHEVGKGQVRPGTTYLGRSYNDLEALLHTFARTPTEKALLELTRYNLRVWVNDALVTRNDVDCTITNGTFFDSGTSHPIYEPYDPAGWQLRYETGAFISVPGTGVLYMGPNNEGSKCYAEHVGTTGSPGTEHALTVIVQKGSIRFKIGSVPDKADLFAETLLDEGVHSLAFTPYGSFYIRFTQLAYREAQISNCTIEAAGPMLIDAPWSDTDLPYFNFEQAADTIFVANKNIYPLKIERRGDTSWSVARYIPEDGPFTDPPGAGEVSLNVSNSYEGPAILSAKVLDTRMEGSLVRTFHDHLHKSISLVAENTWTDTFRVVGIKGTDNNDRRFQWNLSASSGNYMTVTMQRSISGETGEYQDAPIDDGTSTVSKVVSGGALNITYDHLGEEEDNNLLAYHRIGIKPGNYTSGSVSITVTYQGDSGYGVGFLRNVEADGDGTDIEWYEKPNSDGLTKSWELGAWSEYYGWPSAVAIWDNRLWWGRGDTIWGSENGDFYSFDDSDISALGTITRRVATGGASSKINWLTSLQRLIVGTPGSEASVRSNAVGEVITQDNISVKDASNFGSSQVSPVRIDSKGIFIHRTDKKAMLLDYSEGARDYTTASLNDYNDTILEPGIKQLAVQRQPETYIYNVRDDGQMPFLLMQIDEEGNPLVCWARFVTSGEIESIAVLPGTEQDEVYLSVKRVPPPLEDEIIETRSDEMAAPYKAVTAFAFSDGSVTIKDDANPERNYRAQRAGLYTYDDMGILEGPDAFWLSWSGWLGHDNFVIYTRHPDGTYRRGAHNYFYDYINFIGPKDGDDPNGDESYSDWNRGSEPFYLANGGTGIRVTGDDKATDAPNGLMEASTLRATEIDTFLHMLDAGLYVDSDASYYWDSPDNWFSVSLRAREHSTCEIFFRVGINSSDWQQGTNKRDAYDPTYYQYLDRFHVDLVAGTATLIFHDDTQGATTENWVEHLDMEVREQANGWKRYYFKLHLRRAGTYAGVGVGIVLKRDNGDLYYVGDGVEGIDAWGCAQQAVGTWDDYAIWPSANSQDINSWPRNNEQLPWDWDEDGNLIGIRVHDASYNALNYSPVGAMGSYTGVDGGGDNQNRRYWSSVISNGRIKPIEGNYGPDRSTICGRLTYDGTGNSSTYTGLQFTRSSAYSYGYEDTGRSLISIFVRYSGSYKYFTLSQVLTAPTTTDEVYSCTWDIELGVLTEEYHQPGVGSWNPATQGFHTVRQNGIEAFADGWYRIWTKAWTDPFTSGICYWAVSDSPTPGSNTNGIYPTTLAGANGKHCDVIFWQYNVNDHMESSPPPPVRAPSYQDFVWPNIAQKSLPAFAHVVSFQHGSEDNFSWHGYMRPAHELDKTNLTQYHKFTLNHVWDVLINSPDYAAEFPMPEFTIDPPMIGGLYNYDIIEGLPKHPTTTISPTGELTMGVAISYDGDYPNYTSYYYEGTKAAVPGETYTTWCSVNDGATTFKLDGVTYGSRSIPAFEYGDNYTFGDELMMAAWYDYEGKVDYHSKEVMIANTLLPDEPRYIEKVAKHSEATGEQINKMADCGAYYEGPVSSVTLSHLGSRDDIVAWGTRVSDGKAVPVTGLSSDGVGYVDLGESYTDLFIGIRYSALYKSSKLSYAGSGGTALTQPKKITELGLLMASVHRDAVSFGADFEKMRKMNIVTRGKAMDDDTVLSQYDDNRFSFPGRWDTDSRLCLKVDAPYPCTFLGLVIGVETNTRGGGEKK